MASLNSYPNDAGTDASIAAAGLNENATDPPITDAAFMDAEIRLVARFRALVVWRRFISAALAAFICGCTFWGANASSPFYIMVFLNLLPFLLEEFCAPHIKKSAPVLPFLRKKYHYSPLRYATLGITFGATCLLLVLWQFHNSTPAFPAAWMHNFPAFLLAACFFQRAVTPQLAARHIRRRMGC